MAFRPDLANGRGNGWGCTLASPGMPTGAMPVTAFRSAKADKLCPAASGRTRHYGFSGLSLMFLYQQSAPWS